MPSRFQLIKAARAIRNEGVIAYPTESVFGLGCDPFSENAVKKILRIKHRPVDKGLIIIAANLNQLMPYINISTTEKNTITQYESAMTWLVNKSELTPYWISGKHKSIAIRISQHPLVIDLCSTLNHPIVSTSANPAGLKPAASSIKARLYFADTVDVYLSGSTGQLTQPTPITDIKTNNVIRGN